MGAHLHSDEIKVCGATVVVANKVQGKSGSTDSMEVGNKEQLQHERTAHVKAESREQPPLESSEPVEVECKVLMDRQLSSETHAYTGGKEVYAAP